LIYKENMSEEPSVTHDTTAGLPAAAPETPTAAFRWVARVGIALLFSLVVGALPVMVHREIRDLSRLRAEVADVRALNEAMYGRLEDSAARLRALKTPEGASRVMREKGYLPPGARVYQIEILEDGVDASRRGMER
jgi:hypothetical protein